MADLDTDRGGVPDEWRINALAICAPAFVAGAMPALVCICALPVAVLALAIVGLVRLTRSRAQDDVAPWHHPRSSGSQRLPVAAVVRATHRELRTVYCP